MIGIPVHNEANAIGQVVAQCRTLSDCVVVVDDGSTDDSALRAHEAGAIVLRHERNLGKGTAIATLFNYARQHEAQALVLLDGDGQHDPADIVSVLEPCLQNRADVVVGSRYLSIRSEIPWHRSLGLRAISVMTALCSGVPCSDSQSGFRAFNARAIRTIEIAEPSFSVECEQQFECRRHGLRLKEVAISCSYDIPEKRSVVRQGFLVLSRLSVLALRRRFLRLHPPHIVVPLSIELPSFPAFADYDNATARRLEA